MSSELLKEQFNTLVNEQKSKLEILREKKKLMNQQKNNDQSEKKFSIDNEINSEMKKVDDYDHELFAKLDNLDLMDSSDDEKGSKAKMNHQKLMIKKPNKKSPIVNYEATKQEQDALDSVRESLSYADRLREIQDENGRLRKVLAEKEYEIGYLKRRLDEETSLANINNGAGGVEAGATSSKIVELAKKVRELSANLESEKTKNRQLSKTCVDLETRLENYKSRRPANEAPIHDDDDDDVDEDVEKRANLAKENRELKDKLNQISHKMMEFKSQCEILKQDLKKTQKALEKEVGDNVDVKAILSGQSNWRGRQQQITNLQTKVADLKHQLGGVMDMTRQSQMFIVDEELTIDEQCDDIDGVPKSAQPSIYSAAFTASSVRTNLNSRHRSDLKHLESQKKEQYEKLKREYDAMEGDYGSMKEKLEACKARNKVLSNENKTHKEQIKTLLEKGKHDDELVEALLKKQAQMKELLESLSQQHEKTTKELEEKAVQSQVKNMQEKNTIEQMKLIISEREKRVNELEEELRKLKEAFYASFNNANTNSTKQAYDNFFLNDKTTNNKTESSDNNNNESEFIKSRPMSSSRASNIPTPIHRSDSMHEREISSSRFNLKSGRASAKPPAGSYQSQHQQQQQHQYQQRPSSTSSLVNAKAVVEQKKENQIDLKLENSELKTLYKSSEIERVRLLELVKSQQKRIEELNEKTLETENRLNEERRRSANLEKQIERIKLIDTNKNSYSSKYGKNLAAQNTTSTIDQYKLEELETSLLIQKDENEAIKAALKSTLEAKEEDLRLYCEMLETTKKVFLDGIKSYKQIASK